MALKDSCKGNLPNGVALLIYIVWKTWLKVRIYIDSSSMPVAWLVQDQKEEN